jgi:hypothetical protein
MNAETRAHFTVLNNLIVRGGDRGAFTAARIAADLAGVTPIAERLDLGQLAEDTRAPFTPEARARLRSLAARRDASLAATRPRTPRRQRPRCGKPTKRGPPCRGVVIWNEAADEPFFASGGCKYHCDPFANALSGENDEKTS